MHRTILRAVLAGLIAGLVVGVYHNVFTAPLLEEAIALEGEIAAAEAPPGAVEEPPLVSLGLQRVGLALGSGILGAIFGFVMAGAYGLLRWTMPDARPVAAALAAAALGFWALSYLTAIKFPFALPGTGSGDTLVFRQGMQMLFYLLSALGVVGAVFAAGEIRSAALTPNMRQGMYALAAVGYAAFALLIFWLVPNNPDPVESPADLLLQFNNLTLMGHLLTWALMGAGFAWLLWRGQRQAQGDGG